MDGDETEDKSKRFVVRPAQKDEPLETVEAQKVQETPPTVQAEPVQQEPTVKPSPTTKPLQRFKFSQIPTDRIIKTMTNKEMMKQTLKDETLEPHVHMVILLGIVFILAIIISLIGI
jgi:hypothetical protein